jgi:hypothetical protein
MSGAQNACCIADPLFSFDYRLKCNIFRWRPQGPGVFRRLMAGLEMAAVDADGLLRPWTVSLK